MEGWGVGSHPIHPPALNPPLHTNGDSVKRRKFRPDVEVRRFSSFIENQFTINLHIQSWTNVFGLPVERNFTHSETHPSSQFNLFEYFSEYLGGVKDIKFPIPSTEN